MFLFFLGLTLLLTTQKITRNRYRLEMGQYIPTRKSGNSHIVIGDIDLKEKNVYKKKREERENDILCSEYFILV